MNQAKRLFMVLVVLVAIVLLAGPMVSPAVDAQSMWTRFRNVLIDHDLDVDGNVDIDGTLTVDAVDLDGALDLDGQELTIDANADTSMTADTDDQIDWEIGGADIIVWKDFTATALTNTTEYIMEIADTTGIGQSGTNSLAALNIDLGIGDSTAGTNSVYGILIDGIEQDAQNTETALSIGTGWDVAITALGAVNVGADGTSYDVTFFSDTAGDTLLWDQSEEALVLTGTDGQAALNVADGDVVVADDLRVTAQTGLSVTNGAAFTATGTFQKISAAAEVTPTITAGTAGDVLILINEGVNTINIADTGTQVLIADWAGDQFDSLTLFSDGTRWIEIARSDN